MRRIPFFRKNIWLGKTRRHDIMYFIFEFWFVSDLTAGERMIVKGQRLPEFNANRNLHQLHLHQQQLRQGQKLKFISHMDIKYKLDFSVGETLWKVQMHYR